MPAKTLVDARKVPATGDGRARGKGAMVTGLGVICTETTGQAKRENWLDWAAYEPDPGPLM